jgi:hypothetical protein
MPDQRSCSLWRALAAGVSAVLILAGAALKSSFLPYRKTRY